MTWDELLLLDDVALNTAIEATCYARVWVAHRWPGTRGSYWSINGTIAHTARLPRATHCWAKTMALSRRYGVGAVRAGSQWEVRVALPLAAGGAGEAMLGACTEHEDRVARCKLALYAALQSKAVAP